jgi:hypothetical protein
MAHAEGRLIEEMNASMERYRSSSSDPYYKQAMAMQIRAGLRNWEHILLERYQPWTPYVTPAARRGARQCIADARAYVPFL